MASNTQEIEDDINMCPICFEQLNNSKCLPCLHTFCSPCLKSYVTSQAGKDKKSINDFPCPVCRQTIQILDTNVPIKNVVDTFPVDHLVMLKDRSRGMSDKTNKDRPCDPCKQSGDQATASVWCPVCVEALCDNCAFYHKRLKQLRHHEIKAISDMTEKDRTVALLDTDEPCPEHFGKILEVYCVDHKDMCCVICLATKHRKCENISTFDEMVMGEKGEFIENFKTDLLKADKTTETIINCTTNKLEELKVQHDKITGEVSKTVHMAISKLQAMNSKFLTSSKQDYEKHSTNLEERKRKVVIFQKDIKKAYQLLQAVCSSGSPKQIFITKEKLKMQLKSHIELLKQELNDPKDVQLTLQMDDALKALVDTVTSVGKVVSAQSPDTLLVQSLDEFQSLFGIQGTRKLDIKELEVSKLFSIPITGDITGGAFLPNGKMVFCNYSNSILSLHDTSGAIISSTNVTYRPFDVCCITGNEIVVSVASSKCKCIKKYDVSSESFKVVSEIPLKNAPEGLAYTEGKLVVGYPASVDVLTMDGKCLVSVKRTPGNRCYVGVSVDRFYHNDLDSVVCRSFDGTELLRYSSQSISYVAGIALDCYGNMFVCGYTSGNMLVFSEDGKQSKVLISDLSSVFSIRFDTSGTRFCLGTLGPKRSLSVYKIKPK